SRGKSRTVARLAAELRTSLAAILGRAELLDEEGADLGPERAQRVREIVRSARHLSAVVGDLLDLSKLEVGGLTLVVQDVDLGAVVEEVRQQAAAEEARAPQAVEIAPEARHVRGDHGRVRQVVLALFRHALRAAPEGAVRAAAEASGGEV